MLSSSERRHAADATVALLVAARSSIDSAIVALQQASGLLVESPPADEFDNLKALGWARGCVRCGALMPPSSGVGPVEQDGKRGYLCAACQLGPFPLVTEDTPAPAASLPTPCKPPPTGSAPKPRAPRKRASVGEAGPVAASPVPRILVGDPAMFTPPKRPTGAFTLQDALAYYTAEAPVIEFVKAAGPLGVVARVIVEAISGSKATKDHAAPYAALAKLEAGLVLERDGRRYRLGAGLA